MVTHYTVDTGVLIDWWHRFPRDVFPHLWESVSALVQSGRMTCTQAVLWELEEGGDGLLAWAREQNGLFRPVTTEVWETGREVVETGERVKTRDGRPKGLVDADKFGEDADPFVIAEALLEQRRPSLIPEEWIIVADENEHRRDRVSIPKVCKEYGLRCIKGVELFRKEHWSF